MSDKLQEIKEDFAWGVKAAGQGQGYTNLDDEQVSWLIERLEHAHQEFNTALALYEKELEVNQKLVECLEWYAREERALLARHVLSEVKGNG